MTAVYSEASSEAESGPKFDVIMNDLCNQRLFLDDNRQVGFAEFGCPDGFPVMLCHGLPSSRLEGQLFESAAVNNKIRLIVPDRPGYGLSQARNFFSLDSWPQDVIALADALGIGSFSVFGNSGGGPYALACAARIPDRLKQVAIVCGLGPVNHSWARAEMRWVAKYSFILAQHAPFLLRLIYSDVTAAVLRMQAGKGQELLRYGLPAADVEVLNRPEIEHILTQAWLEALRKGSSGALGDLIRNTSDWGFDISDITRRVHLWHGCADRVVPVSHAHYYLEYLPNVKVRLVENEGHFSLPVNHADEILETLGSD